MQPTCRPSCTFAMGTCYCQCPPNSEPAAEDISRCVPTVMSCEDYAAAAAARLQITPTESLLTSDVTFTLNCNKTPIAKSGSTCATGFTEWQAGTCYLNCPSGLTEGGLFCIKRTLTRSAEEPSCNSWFYWHDGTGCSVNPLSALVLTVVVGFFILMAFYVYNVGRISRGRSAS